jgi:hypothetical protein
VVLFGDEVPDGAGSGTEFEPGLTLKKLQVLVSLKQYVTKIFPLVSLSVMVTLPLLQFPAETELQASPEQAAAICGAATRAIVVANAKPSLCVMIVSPSKEWDLSCFGVGVTAIGSIGALHVQDAPRSIVAKQCARQRTVLFGLTQSLAEEIDGDQHCKYDRD